MELRTKYFSDKHTLKLALTGEIGADVTFSDFYTTIQRFKRNETLPDLEISIDSYGGYVHEGELIANYLKNYGGKVTTYTSTAGSIATIIACAGKERIADDNAIFMIHGIKREYKQNEMVGRKKLAETLEAIDKTSKDLINSYLAVTKEEQKEKYGKIYDNAVMGEVDYFFKAEQLLESGLMNQLVASDEFTQQHFTCLGINTIRNKNFTNQSYHYQFKNYADYLESTVIEEPTTTTTTNEEATNSATDTDQVTTDITTTNEVTQETLQEKDNLQVQETSQQQETTSNNDNTDKATADMTDKKTDNTVTDEKTTPRHKSEVVAPDGLKNYHNPSVVYEIAKKDEYIEACKYSLVNKLDNISESKAEQFFEDLKEDDNKQSLILNAEFTQAIDEVKLNQKGLELKNKSNISDFIQEYKIAKELKDTHFKNIGIDLVRKLELPVTANNLFTLLKPSTEELSKICSVTYANDFKKNVQISFLEGEGKLEDIKANGEYPLINGDVVEHEMKLTKKGGAYQFHSHAVLEGDFTHITKMVESLKNKATVAVNEAIISKLWSKTNNCIKVKTSNLLTNEDLERMLDAFSVQELPDGRILKREPRYIVCHPLLEKHLRRLAYPLNIDANNDITPSAMSRYNNLEIISSVTIPALYGKTDKSAQIFILGEDDITLLLHKSYGINPRLEFVEGPFNGGKFYSEIYYQVEVFQPQHIVCSGTGHKWMITGEQKPAIVSLAGVGV